VEDVSDLDRIIRKIKRCLALGSSGNANEAEMALRQARKLMDTYRLSHADLHVSDVGSETRSTGKQVTPYWQRSLADVAGAYFRCQTIIQFNRVSPNRYESVFRFIGVKPNAELASYAYDSLLTQIMAARRNYTDTLQGSPGRRRSRADTFCRAWVHAVSSKIAEFARVNKLDEIGTGLVALEHADSQAIDLWIKQNVGRVNDAPAMRAKRYNKSDLRAGYQSGTQAELRQGVGESESPLVLGAPRLALTAN